MSRLCNTEQILGIFEGLAKSIAKDFHRVEGTKNGFGQYIEVISDEAHKAIVEHGIDLRLRNSLGSYLYVRTNQHLFNQASAPRPLDILPQIFSDPIATAETVFSP